MKLYQILLIALLFLTIACNNKPVGTVNIPESVVTDSVISECYMYAEKKDTVWLKINIDGTLVTGDLLYAFYEKDKNYGSIEGSILGDTLFVKYTFESEGITSLRDEVFLKQNNTYLVGWVDRKEEEGEMRINDKSKINFENTMTLMQVKCD